MKKERTDTQDARRGAETADIGVQQDDRDAVTALVRW
jgi:hypothetical protein